jgi:hypothetical protein
MRSPIEIEMHLKGGSVIDVMQRVAPITTLLFLKTLYVPTILTLILDPVDTRRSTLLINYDYLPDLINEFLMSYSTARLPVGKEITNGDATPD